MSAPEFSRPWRLDAIGAGDVRTEVEADADERAGLATRFGLVALERLKADYVLRRDLAGILATGHLSARATQACSVSGDPLPARIETDFAIRFLPDPGSAAADEIELDADECDVIFYSGSSIDLGDAAAETFALELDPFPRGPEAEATLKDAGILSEEEAGPFGGLAALREKLAKPSD